MMAAGDGDPAGDPVGKNVDWRNHIAQCFPRCWGVKIISVPQKQYDSSYAESSILILR